MSHFRRLPFAAAALLFGCTSPGNQAAPSFEFYARDARPDFPQIDTMRRPDAALPMQRMGYGLALDAVAGTYTNDTGINPCGGQPSATFMIVTLRDASGNGPADDWILSFEQGGMVKGTTVYPAGAKYLNAFPDFKASAASSAPWTLLAIEKSDSSHAIRYETSVVKPTTVLSPPQNVTASLGMGGDSGPSGVAKLTWTPPSTPVRTYVASLIPHLAPGSPTVSATVSSSQTSAALMPMSGTTYDVSVLGVDVDELGLAADTHQIPTLPPQVNAAAGTGSSELVVP